MNILTIILMPILCFMSGWYVWFVYKSESNKITEDLAKSKDVNRISVVKRLIDNMVKNNTCMDEFTVKIILLGSALKEGRHIDENFFSNPSKRDE